MNAGRVLFLTMLALTVMSAISGVYFGQRAGDGLDPDYAAEVACGLSPIRMAGDGERIAKWAETHREFIEAWARVGHVECNL